jgi:hypothetical protein
MSEQPNARLLIDELHKRPWLAIIGPVLVQTQFPDFGRSLALLEANHVGIDPDAYEARRRRLSEARTVALRFMAETYNLQTFLAWITDVQLALGTRLHLKLPEAATYLNVRFDTTCTIPSFHVEFLARHQSQAALIFSVIEEVLFRYPV